MNLSSHEDEFFDRLEHLLMTSYMIQEIALRLPAVWPRSSDCRTWEQNATNATIQRVLFILMEIVYRTPCLFWIDGRFEVLSVNPHQFKQVR
ncbi:MAG: hypothetical protein C5B47_04995 [Verrucomicrobia bacterium]|nr:MAG: hypothetical protein C5B47_04995 [Verrucomicrobiota bacterium]